MIEITEAEQIERLNARVVKLMREKERLRAYLVKAHDILVKAALQRDCFHTNGTTMKNAAGNDLFIDANKIDAAIADIKALSLSDEKGK